MNAESGTGNKGLCKALTACPIHTIIRTCNCTVGIEENTRMFKIQSLWWVLLVYLVLIITSFLIPVF